MTYIILSPTVIISTEPMLHVGDTMPSKALIKPLLFLNHGVVLAAWFLWELDEASTFVQCKR